MATLTRWTPFNEMLSLREAMNQLLEESYVAPQAAQRGQNVFSAALDLSETADAYQVELVLPGVKPEDVEITFENNVLSVKGHVKQERRDEKRSYHRIERRYGTFQRTVTLPSTVKGDAIQAELSNGILRLEIPKAEEVKPRRINVQVGAEKPIEINNN